MKRYWPVLLFSILAAVVYADTPPPVSLQSILKAAPKAVPIGSDTHLTAMKGNTLVYVNATSIKPAVATTSSAGIVKVGTGLAVTEDGTLNNTGMAGVASFKGRGGAVVPATGDYSIGQITGASTVAATGSYNDLANKPTIPAAQVQANWGQANAAAVDYIQGKPTIPTALSQLTQDTTHRTVTDAEKTQWNTTTASVNSVNGQTATVVLTATDVGADPLGSATSVQTNLNTHTTRTDNPHSVTKAQLGLGNVDNTSDAAKPISTATQSALDLKANANALPANTSAVSHYFLTGYNSSTKAFSMAQPDFTDIASKPTTLAGYGITDALSATGTAAAATKLATARTINGVSFDGTANITVADSTKAPIDNPTFTTGVTAPIFTSNAADHMIECSNAGDFDTTGLTTSNAGRFCFNRGTSKFRYWTGSAVADMGGSGGGTWGSITGTLSSQSDLNTALAAKAPLASPALTGTPTAPTAAGGTNSTQIATTAFVQSAVSSLGSGTIGGTVGSTADRIPVASGTGGSTLKASTVSIDPTTGATTVPKQSGVADGLLFYNGNSTETTGMGIVGPATTMATSYYWQPSATPPTAGQTIQFGTPATQPVNGVSSTVVPVSYVTAATSGTYTPTVTNVTNTSGLTPYLAHWQRIGNEVSVWGQVDVSVTTGGSQSSVLITLPPGATSTFTDGHDLEGVATAYPGSHSAIAQGDTSTGKANLVWNDSTSGSLLWKYSFAYTVK